MTDRAPPLAVALVDDYEVVLAGVKHMLNAYQDRIVIAAVSAGQPIDTPVDIALCDTFAQQEAPHNDFAGVLSNPLVQHTVIYTWVFGDDVVRAALDKGASGYLAKALPARQLVDALERIAGGDVVVSQTPGRSPATVGQDWPGRSEGLTERESEIVALITQGYPNSEIAGMKYLSINSIKTYIRTAYRKMGVTSRSRAVLWGVEHGFLPPGHGSLQ